MTTSRRQVEPPVAVAAGTPGGRRPGRGARAPHPGGLQVRATSTSSSTCAACPDGDSAGIRALVRGHTSAQRLNRRFTLVSPNPRVREAAANCRCSITCSRSSTRWSRPRRRSIPLGSRLVVAWPSPSSASALVGVGVTWPDLGLENTLVTGSSLPGVPLGGAGGLGHPFFELAKLVAAALIGMLVTVVHRQYRSERHAEPDPGSGAGPAVHLRRADDDHHRQLGRARVRHRRRGEHHPLPHAGRRRARHHDPVHPDGPRHGRGPGRASRWPASARCSCAR